MGMDVTAYLVPDEEDERLDESRFAKAIARLYGEELLCDSIHLLTSKDAGSAFIENFVAYPLIARDQMMADKWLPSLAAMIGSTQKMLTPESAAKAIASEPTCHHLLSLGSPNWDNPSVSDEFEDLEADNGDLYFARLAEKAEFHHGSCDVEETEPFEARNLFIFIGKGCPNAEDFQTTSLFDEISEAFNSGWTGYTDYS